MFKVVAKQSNVHKLKNKIVKELKDFGVSNAYVSLGKTNAVTLFYTSEEKLSPKELGTKLEPILDLKYLSKKKGIELNGEDTVDSMILLFGSK